MHEFAITRSLLQEVVAEAGRNGARRINRITLLIGEQSSIVPECVQFNFDQLKEGTIAEQARLEFHRVPLRIRCPKCGREFSAIEEMCSCNAGGEITGGDEMIIESIEIE
ncbi:MAG: hydrogenase maturation nickel metallochaperone HypA/HybF [bacterium]